MKIQAFVPKQFAILNNTEKSGIVDVEFELSSLSQNQREVLSRFIPENLAENYEHYYQIPSEFRDFITQDGFLLKLKSATFDSLIEVINEISLIDKELKKEQEKRKEKERKKEEFIEQFSKAIVENGILENGNVKYENTQIELLESSERTHVNYDYRDSGDRLKVEFTEWECRYNIWSKKESEKLENVILIYKDDLSKEAKETINKELNRRNLKEQKIRDEKMIVLIEKEIEKERKEEYKWALLLAKVLTDEQRERYSENFLSQKELHSQIREKVFECLDNEYPRYENLTYSDLSHGNYHNCYCDDYEGDIEELCKYWIDDDEVKLSKEQYTLYKHIKTLSKTITEQFGGEIFIEPRMHYGRLKCSKEKTEKLGIKVFWEMDSGKSFSREYGIGKNARND